MTRVARHPAAPPPAPLEEREREYSPSSCIGGDYLPFIEAYRIRSAEARARAEALGGRWLQGRYGPRPAQTLALCLPSPAARPAPRCALLVYIHGGYWQELAAADSLFAAAHCIGNGIAFAALDYTLAPQASVAAIADECGAALDWLHANAPAHGIAADQVVIAGSSAGAHLAATLARPGRCAPGAAGRPRPRAVVLVSGIYWLEPLVGTSINLALGLDTRAARAASPGLAALEGFPPALVCWGEIETAAFKDQSARFAESLRAAGTRCDTLEVPGRNHFDVVLDLADPATPLGRRTLGLFGAG